MQMIDDWVDQDEDRSARLTPVATGNWNLESPLSFLPRRLSMLLDASGIRQPILKAILADLYKDCLCTALAAMRAGVAA